MICLSSKGYVESIKNYFETHERVEINGFEYASQEPDDNRYKNETRECMNHLKNCTNIKELSYVDSVCCGNMYFEHYYDTIELPPNLIKLELVDINKHMHILCNDKLEEIKIHEYGRFDTNKMTQYMDFYFWKNLPQSLKK